MQLNVRSTKTLTKDLETLKHGAKQARLPFDKDMLLNVAFFLDHQYVEWIGTSNMLRGIPRSKGMENAPRPVSNKIMHFVMQEHALALQDRPIPDVQPASDEPVDLSMASPARAYVQWLTEPNVTDFDDELSDAVFWSLIAGEGYLKWTYDADEEHPDMASICPLDIFVDPFATKFNRARYVIHEQFLDIDEAQAMYDVANLKPSQVDESKSTMLREMGQAPVLNGVLINELWVKPGGAFPNGLFCAWTGNTVLVEPRPFPYKHGQLPFTQLGSIPKPKTAHYTCAVKYLRQPQMELNKYHAQKLMSRQNFASPKWWVPTDLELEHDPDDSPNQVLRGNSMGGSLKPEIIQGSFMQDTGDGEWIRNEMMDVVGLHEVSQSQVPGRVEAAKAIEMLRESDVSRLSELNRTMRAGLSKGFWQSLMLLKQYGKEEQMVQVYSPEGYPEVHHFLTKYLKPTMRVRVSTTTGLSKSRAARQEQAITLWQNGVIRDPEIFAQMIDVPVDSIAPQRAFDIRLSRNENLTIMNGGKAGGIAVTPNSWDEHTVHIREHNNFRKTNEFSEADDDVKKKFEYHVQQHEVMELSQLQKRAELAQMRTAVAQGQEAETQQDQVMQDPATSTSSS